MRGDSKWLLVSILGMVYLFVGNLGTAGGQAFSTTDRRLECPGLTLKSAWVDPADGRSWGYEFAGICQVLDVELKGNSRKSRLVTEGFATVKATWDDAENEAQEALILEGGMDGKIEYELKCDSNPFEVEQRCILLDLGAEGDNLGFLVTQIRKQKSPITAGKVDPKWAWQLAARGPGKPPPPPAPPPPAPPKAVSIPLGFSVVDPVVMEGEDLAAKVSGQGNAGAQDMRPFGQGWSNNGHLFWNPSGVGSLLNIPLHAVGPGSYVVTVHLTKAPDFARVRAYARYARADGGSADTRYVDFDGYAPQVGGPSPVALSVASTSGAMTLVLVTMGRNPASTGLFSGIDKIEIKRAP